MKILKDSGRTHWIHAKEITCGQCDTVYQTETEDDFTTVYDHRVCVECPKCGFVQNVDRHDIVDISPLPWLPCPYPNPQIQPWTPWQPTITWYNDNKAIPWNIN